MSRNEFSKPIKRLALKRSGGLCEASGAMYGLEPNHRCDMPLSHGVEFDHVILEANSHDASLENCAAVCLKCHDWKTAHTDIPTAAKTVRQQDKSLGIKRTSRPMNGSKTSPFKRKLDGTVVRR